MDSPASSQEMRASQASLHFSDSGSDKENAVARATAKRPAVVFEDGSSSSEDNDDGNAYERVRRQLLGAQGNKQTPQDAMTHDSAPSALRSISSSPAPVAPKGRMARRMQNLFGGDSEDEDELQESNVRVDTQAKEQAARPDIAASHVQQGSAPSGEELTTTPIRQHRSIFGNPQSSSPRNASPQPSYNSLFLSPARPASNQVQSSPSVSDDELAPVPSRLQALVAKKREERLAKEKAAEEARQQSESDDMPEQVRKPTKKARKQVVVAPIESEGGSEGEGDEALTQHNRPTRKASKKAIEEMNRETQRMQRNMQLTHQAKTKTTFTTGDLFKRFNFRQPKAQAQDVQASREAQQASVSASSDVEQAPSSDTPPSSPPSLTDKAAEMATEAVHAESPHQTTGDSDSDGPSLEEVFKAARRQPTPEQQSAKPKISVREFMKRAGKRKALQPDDDDLVLVQNKNVGGVAVLDRVPPVRVRETHAVHALHTLSHLHEQDVKPRKGARKSMAPSELSAHLRQLARKQAMADRDEKIQSLKDRGIYVQTAEERERDQLQLENMLEKARHEAEELAQREKDAAKREGREVEKDVLDSDDDEDYVASGDEEDVQLSGSEDEGSHADDEGSEAEDEVEQEAQNPLVDELASEAGDDEAEGKDDNAEDMVAGNKAEEIIHSTPARPAITRRKRKTLVDSDDEEEAQPTLAIINTPTPGRPTPKTPKSALAAAFGFGQAQEAGPGLSQMFAGTMGESQDDDSPHHAAFDSQQDSLAFLRGIAPPSMPNFGGLHSPVVARDDQDILVQNSQAGETQFAASETQGLGLDMVHFETQTQMPYVETQVTASQLPDATQDEGFQAAFSPVRPLGGEPNPSNMTVDTVLLDTPATMASPMAKRKGRLQRRGQDDSEVVGPIGDAEEDGEFEISANAFDVMRKASKTNPAAEADFDRKKSEAKGMVDEQAEESEDEYAGLGGASDDESAGELDAETKAALIDDTTKEKLNERQVAAFFADKERADDEKRVEKLFKDIANGGLRRKRGADLELWDSDDEDEAAKRKRAAKQREFAKMRRALLADEKLGKIAENPKQAAFLQAIEDRQGEDEVFFLDAPEEVPEEATQSQSVGDGAATSDLKRKRADDDDEDENEQERPPAKQSTTNEHVIRRSGRFTKPTTLLDIRATLSELIGEPMPARHTSDDEDHHESEEDHEDEEDDEAVLDSQPLDDFTSRAASPALLPAEEGIQPARTHPRRTPANTSRTAVIDRIAMKRSRSSSLAAKAAGSAAASRQAFFSPSVAGAGSFKVPSLLRRATTNASNASESSHTDSLGSVNVNTGGMGKEVVKMGGSKKSSVNYYVREKERRAKVEEVERARSEGRKKVGLMRRKEVGLGLAGRVGGGGFEE